MNIRKPSLPSRRTGAALAGATAMIGAAVAITHFALPDSGVATVASTGYQVTVTGADSQGLAVESEPHVGHLIKYVPNGTQLSVACQTSGDQVDGRTSAGKPYTVWDQLTDGTYVYDWYTNSQVATTEGRPLNIPSCGATANQAAGNQNAGNPNAAQDSSASSSSPASSANSAADASGCPMAQQDASPNSESPDIMAPLNSMPLNQRVACAEATLHAAAQTLNKDVQSPPPAVGPAILMQNYHVKLDGVDNLVNWLTLHGNNDNAADAGPVDLHQCRNNGGQAQLLGFDDRSGGRVIASLGDVQHASHVVVMVGGVGRGLNGNLFEDLCNAQETYDAATKQGSVAVIIWVGYDAPTGFTDVHAAYPDMAKAGAQPLLDFLGGLPNILPNNPHLTLMAHSYGTEVAGYAAQLKTLPVGDLILIGSPGVPEAKASEFNLPQHVWAAVVPGEQIGTADTLHIGGTPPTDSSFGARVFSAISGTPDHSSYWDPHGDALPNMAYIITNQPQYVQNCAVKAVSGSHTPQKVCTPA